MTGFFAKAGIMLCSTAEGLGEWISAVPGNPVAQILGLFGLLYGFLQDIVACSFGQLGFPGSPTMKKL